MRSAISKLALVGMILFLAVLACSFPGVEEVEQEIQEQVGLPTAAPTPAPVGEAGQDTPGGESASSLGETKPAEPVVLQGAALMSSYGSNPDVYCQLEQVVTLTVQPDGSAELVALAPGFIDHDNCTRAEGLQGWYVQGAVGADGKVVFTSCNNGGFIGQGSMDYSSGILHGEARCLVKDTQAITISFLIP